MPDRPVCASVPVMIVAAWRRLLRPASSRPSPPEPSACAGRRSGARRPATPSDSFAPSSARAVAGVRRSVRSLRRGLLPALLFLPLLVGLATEASAQHSLSPSAAEVYEGETRTFTVTFASTSLGIAPTVTVTGGTAVKDTDYTLSNIQAIGSGSIVTGVSFDIAGTTDASTEGDETINIQAYNDGVNRFNFTVTLKDGARPSPPTVTITGGAAVTEGGDASFTLNLNPAPTADLRVDFTVSEETGGGQSFVTPGNYTSRSRPATPRRA